MKLFALSACCAALTLGGCIGTLDGKHQAGVPLVSDTVEGHYERPLNVVWKAVRETLMYNGRLTVENLVGKNFEAKVDTCTVWVLLDDPGPNLTKVQVQVRTKGGGSDKELASQIREQIAIRLAAGGTMPTSPPPKAK
jgi:hypothetical protein